MKEKDNRNKNQINFENDESERLYLIFIELSETERTISNEYLSFNIIKDFFYFQALKSSDSKMKFVGGIQVNF